ncbi:MAG TPA: glycosyltransferase [Candidatus Limnocylindrales bacterium]|nr:glycosyltransferase [Candidatus Limnocylindrales bacterium]
MSHFTFPSVKYAGYRHMTSSLKFRKYRYLIFTTPVTVFLQDRSQPWPYRAPNCRRMRKIEFGFFDAGGGHRAAATALQTVIQTQRLPLEPLLTNLQDLMEPLDILKRYGGIRIQDFYNSMLRTGWTLGATQLMKALQFAIRIYHRPTVRLLAAHWKETNPDMLVSVVPHFNRALGESFAKAFPERPFVTILTDIADYPPHFWIERQKQYFICGSERAVEQARAHGHPAERIFRTSGMILNPKFYQPATEDRVAGRQRLGLALDLPTGLLLFGGHGSEVMLEIAERLDRSPLQLQLIFICGKSEKLAAALRARQWRMPHFVEGFTKEVNRYMHLADFFIGKPGPGSVSEALAMRLPVIVECNAWTLPQERYNADWVLEKQFGEVLTSFRQIVPAVARMIEPVSLARYRENIPKLENRAVFEIPGILEEILDRSSEANGRTNGALLAQGA